MWVVAHLLLLTGCVVRASSYEACWPAVTKDVNGVILVYNPESHIHESEAMLWCALPPLSLLAWRSMKMALVSHTTLSH